MSLFLTPITVTWAPPWLQSAQQYPCCHLLVT